jgi:hypothetical protein
MEPPPTGHGRDVLGERETRERSVGEEGGRRERDPSRERERDEREICV